jgi:hypothetical protein
MTTSSTSTARSLDWPAGATSHTTDLGGPVHHLDFGGPPGAPVVLAVHGLGRLGTQLGAARPAAHRHLPGARRRPVRARPQRRSHRPRRARRRPGHAAPLRRRGRRRTRRAARPLDGRRAGTAVRRRARRHGDPAGPAQPAGARHHRPHRPGTAGPARPPQGPRRRGGRTPRTRPADCRAARGPAAGPGHPACQAAPAAAVAASVAETRLRQGGPTPPAPTLCSGPGSSTPWHCSAGPTRGGRPWPASTSPTLWLQGADDPMVAPGPAARLAATRPDWPFRLREGVGHLLALEDPEWTAAQLRGWLR